MKRRIISFVLVLLLGMTFEACKAKEDRTDIPDVSEEKSDITLGEEKEYMKTWQPRGIEFGEEKYLVMQEGIYRISKGNDMEKLMTCKDAVGTVYDDELYWAIRDNSDNVRIIKMDKEQQIFELGELSKALPPKSIDLYENILYIKNILEGVEGYVLDDEGNIGNKLADNDMLLYKEDNEAARQREDNENNGGEAGELLYHFIDAGYSERVYQKQFLVQYVSRGETGKNILFSREDGVDTELLEFYENALLHENNIVYISNIESNEISVYDLSNKSNEIVCSFEDGTFEMMHVDENMVYGVWDSIEQNRKIYAGIDLETGERKDFFEAESGAKYIQIGQNVYYEDNTEQKILCADLSKEM